MGDHKCTKIECGIDNCVTSVESDLLSPETERDGERESCSHEAKLIVGNFQEQQSDTNLKRIFYTSTLKR